MKKPAAAKEAGVLKRPAARVSWLNRKPEDPPARAAERAAAEHEMEEEEGELGLEEAEALYCFITHARVCNVCNECKVCDACNVCNVCNVGNVCKVCM